MPALAELVTPVPLRTKAPSPAPSVAPPAPMPPVSTPPAPMPPAPAPASAAPGAPAAGAAVSPTPAVPPAVTAPLAGTAPASVGPNWAAFVSLASAEVDETELISTHEVKGRLVSDDIYRIVARRPSLARCEGIAGVNKGGVVVWKGGEKVLAHPGGVLSHVVVIAKRHDPRATDLLGYGCGETTFANIAAYWTTHGTLAESTGPVVAGAPTAIVTWTPEPGFFIGTTKEELYLSTATHLPVATKGYIGASLVEDSKFTNVAVNANVPDSAFDVRAKPATR